MKTLTLMTPESLKEMFDKINADCVENGESQVPLTDTEYYAQQIKNIFGFGDKKSRELAKEISNL